MLTCQKARVESAWIHLISEAGRLQLSSTRQAAEELQNREPDCTNSNNHSNSVHER